MDDMIAIIAFIYLMPASLLGLAKFVDILHETLKVSGGHVRVFFRILNGRVLTLWAIPKDKKISLKGKSYDYSDSPEFLVPFNSFFGVIPTIMVDEKSAKQLKMSGEADPKAINPQKLDGVITMAYKRGYIDGIGSAANFKIYFLILGLLMAIGFAAMKLIK